MTNQAKILRFTDAPQPIGNIRTVSSIVQDLLWYRVWWQVQFPVVHRILRLLQATATGHTDAHK